MFGRIQFYNVIEFQREYEHPALAQYARIWMDVGEGVVTNMRFSNNKNCTNYPPSLNFLT